jgi:hypothetical protein
MAEFTRLPVTAAAANQRSPLPKIEPAVRPSPAFMLRTASTGAARSAKTDPLEEPASSRPLFGEKAPALIFHRPKPLYCR